MTTVAGTFRVCNQCQGVIPGRAPHIKSVSAAVAQPGQSDVAFSDLDFCCSEHLTDYVAAQTEPIPTPDPPYPKLPPL